MVKLGATTLHTIETGAFRLDGGAMFGVVPKPLWERRIPADDRNRIPLRMRCLLIESADRLMLIDTGIGHKYDEKFADIFAVDHATHTLKGSLEEKGFSPDDITDVVLTHLHFDHCGGATRREGDRLTVTFPQAAYYVQDAQWVSANDPNPREAGSFLEDNLQPLEDSGQLHLLQGPMELMPGVAVAPVNGHTEAQQIVRIEGQERTLVFVADLLPTTSHLKPAWTMSYDVRPLQTMKEKASFLKRAARENWQLFFEHDPEVEVASLREGDRGFETYDHRSLSEL